MAQRARWREEAYYYANETQTVVSRPIANGVTRGLLGYVYRPRSPLLHVRGDDGSRVTTTTTTTTTLVR